MIRLCIHVLIMVYVMQMLSLQTMLATNASNKLPIITRSSKNDLPPDLLAQVQASNISILKPTDADRLVLYQNYADGSTLFTNHPDVAQKFNAMIQAIKTNPDLIEFFRKIHITSLNSVYVYMMQIYTNFNLTNPGAIQDTETTTADVTKYLQNEALYATSKKKLIINHFVNLIQAQFSASIISYVPTTPPDMAVSLGKIFINNDGGIDLTKFAKPSTDEAQAAEQKTYLDFLSKYITFFQAYTNLLTQQDKASGRTQFAEIATSLQNTSQSMKPAMFFYDADSMRSIDFIPFAASTIPNSSQLIPWAESIVNAAIKNSQMNGHPIAYFKDAAGKQTQNQKDAQHLFVITETGPALFEQELLAQPAWLNTQDGSVRILRACLGDFSALMGMGILDEEIELILKKTGIEQVSAKKK